MGSQAPVDLEVVYAPIEEDLRRLRRFLEREFLSREPIIHEILQHIARFRGKQIRPALLFLLTRLLGGEVGAGVVKIGAVLELIHTATLVHDDVLDDSLLRRNVETVHRRWGDRAAVLIGDYIYSRAFQLSTEVEGMAQLLSQTTHTVCEGELLQIGSRRNSDVSEARYLEIIRKKTAELYAVACQLGGRFAGCEERHGGDLYAFGRDLGTAFQIVDDCIDFSGDEAVAGKSLGTDLRQGKMTLPLIYLRDESEPERAEWLRRVLREPLTPAVEERIHALVRENGVLVAAFDRAEGFIQSAKDRLLEVCKRAELFDSPLRASLELAADYVLHRQR
jgi:octaprenyl-diphosphate synthase